MIIDVDAGSVVTRKGLVERELHVVLEGLFEAADDDVRLALFGPGELFGEMAFFASAHRRSASVVAVTDGRLLVLRAGQPPADGRHRSPAGGPGPHADQHDPG